ncbi:MAG TPA: universal stress protein [Oligoflexus sp.]|uniref:universal stress protein n=1 Tax=Oligoflexus sp. TaxID=1971216 RepID=UPI002D35CC31|nr:universal stress protein [Oligoflexus sp.]HYX31747.1 universal stress protein [Oligoflexus sp.]
MNIWKAQKKPIVMGMRLDDHEDLLLQSTMSLAKKLQSSVELVHCFESAIDYSSAGNVLPKATRQGPTMVNPWSEDRAQASLQALAHASDPSIESHVHVERGDPAENLSQIAQDVGAGLIVCGMREQPKPWALKGLSTALSLAFYAPVPVLILPLRMAIDFHQPVSILIADSLGGEGWQILESGLNLARYLDCEAVYHSHVLKAQPWDIQATVNDMAETRTQGRLSWDIDLTPESLQTTLLQKINEELFYRFHNTSCGKDLLHRYHQVAAIGDIHTEFNRMIDQGTKLVIMGRHQFFSNKRLNLDHIPYQAMMEQKAGLLVIPS